jgi:subtilase family serine protease
MMSVITEQMVYGTNQMANIALVLASSATIGSVGRAISFALTLNPTVVSMSFGIDELAVSPRMTTTNGMIEVAIAANPVQAAKTVFVASSGDSNTLNYPSSSPNVLSIGGTTIQSIKSPIEKTWYSARDQGSGGGASKIFKVPQWQSTNSGQYRTTPDISFVADPMTGVASYCTTTGGWNILGGTSVGAPAISGIISIANEIRQSISKANLTSRQLLTGIYGMYGTNTYPSFSYKVIQTDEDNPVSVSQTLTTGLGTSPTCAGGLLGLLKNL